MPSDFLLALPPDTIQMLQAGFGTTPATDVALSQIQDAQQIAQGNAEWERTSMALKAARDVQATRLHAIEQEATLSFIAPFENAYKDQQWGIALNVYGGMKGLFGIEQGDDAAQKIAKAQAYQLKGIKRGMDNMSKSLHQATIRTEDVYGPNHGMGHNVMSPFDLWNRAQQGDKVAGQYLIETNIPQSQRDDVARFLGFHYEKQGTEVMLVDETNQRELQDYARITEMARQVGLHPVEYAKRERQRVEQFENRVLKYMINDDMARGTAELTVKAEQQMEAEAALRQTKIAQQAERKTFQRGLLERYGPNATPEFIASQTVAYDLTQGLISPAMAAERIIKLRENLPTDAERKLFDLQAEAAELEWVEQLPEGMRHEGEVTAEPETFLAGMPEAARAKIMKNVPKLTIAASKRWIAKNAEQQAQELDQKSLLAGSITERNRLAHQAEVLRNFKEGVMESGKIFRLPRPEGRTDLDIDRIQRRMLREDPYYDADQNGRIAGKLMDNLTKEFDSAKIDRDSQRLENILNRYNIQSQVVLDPVRLQEFITEQRQAFMANRAEQNLLKAKIAAGRPVPQVEYQPEPGPIRQALMTAELETERIRALQAGAPQNIPISSVPFEGAIHVTDPAGRKGYIERKWLSDALLQGASVVQE